MALLFVVGCTQTVTRQPTTPNNPPSLPTNVGTAEVDTVETHHQINIEESGQTTEVQQESHPVLSTPVVEQPVVPAPVTQENSLSGLTLDTPPKLENTNDPQDAIFYVGYGWTGGMGDPVLREDDSSLVKQYDGLGIYLKSGSMESILEKGGGLPDCYYDPLLIKVSANVTLVETTDTNYSIEDAPEQNYYQLTINSLNEILIHGDECE